MKNSDWFWEGEMINGYALLAIEIPIHGKPKLTGDDIEDAKQSFDMKNNPSVMVDHPLYGRVSAELVKKLVVHHTSHHFHQFGLM